MKNTVMTIGNFDGLHLGHLKLIYNVKKLSEKYKIPSLVCCFDTNTKNYTSLLFPQNQLKEYLDEIGIDYYRKLNFIDEIKELSCEEFVTKYIVSEYNAKYLIVGEDFYFGKGKSGDVNTLKGLGVKYGFKTIVIKLLKRGKDIISSTYIRGLLKDGHTDKANRLMYKPLSVYGRVKKGYGIGKSIISLPTANISVPKKCALLKLGVYKTRIIIDNSEYDAITNIGYAPIKPKKSPVIESFVFDFDSDIYGKRIKLIFLKYIRSERKFANVKALQKQIQKDIIAIGKE